MDTLWLRDPLLVHHGSMSMRYDDVIASLRAAYDGGAERRDGSVKAPWKIAERAAFLNRLQDGGHMRLLEIGAGTGQDSAYFQDNGLEVVAVDLSPAMVALCRDKGIEAHAMDFLHLDFAPESFDAVYALNCLLHVPNRDLPAVLDAIHMLIRPGGLFYLGVYGGGTLSGEGSFDDDSHQPPRFFSFRSDAQLQEFVGQFFEIVDFHVVGSDDTRFQSLTLRRSK
ncbi:methyltransferase family protein [Nonomuraea polychroma]|uniref:Methyltransferase family protein n=2 Tax=Nonomuraea polychroma TaxID=46176 RepID=A0A438MJP7_9ACTN|nr:methyltransferase family protein [Nonomuraea polychroma]